MDTLKIIIFSICVLVVTYAIAKKNRIFFNYGYLIVAIMIIMNELLLFASGYELINLALAGLFLIQAILVIPNKLPPLTKKGSVIARTAVPKIMFSLTIINFFFSLLRDSSGLYSTCCHVWSFDYGSFSNFSSLFPSYR